ncbi:Putative bacterial antitoxin YdaS [uncultured Caudovirales phage]|uniref:Bacterial antitoxin YdaS n=1 Tax=uncultured Caudovirales phage TaxID=2100421 RepID=A0A6J5TAY3_9CAUD|nr:Putative bacterial antitoxin YdaS [uncultured Caudovirales phage]
MTGIEQAIHAAGSQKRLAELLGCSQQNVSFWLRQGYCPPERVVEVEQATGIDRALLINPKLLDLLTPASL